MAGYTNKGRISINPDISLWLIPMEGQKVSLQKTIDNLAQKYGACSFIPHITVYYLSTAMKFEEVIPIVQRAVEERERFSLTARGIFYSDIFTKTLYIQYEISPPFNEVYQRLKEKFQPKFNYQLSPHLSLIYKNNMDEKEKERLSAQIQYPKTLYLDSLMVITKSGGTITQERDVLDWQVSYEAHFK